MRLPRWRKSLTVNAASLMIATVVTNALGLVFWVVAARLKSPVVVGRFVYHCHAVDHAPQLSWRPDADMTWANAVSVGVGDSRSTKQSVRWNRLSEMKHVVWVVAPLYLP